MVFKMLKGHIVSNCNKKGIVGDGVTHYLTDVKLTSFLMDSGAL